MTDLAASHAGVGGEDLAALLHGRPLRAADEARVHAWGFVLVRADELRALRAAVTFDRLRSDPDLLAEVLVDLHWVDRHGEQVAS